MSFGNGTAPERVVGSPKVPAKLLLKDWGSGVTKGVYPGYHGFPLSTAGHALRSHLLGAAAGAQRGRPREEGDGRSSSDVAALPDPALAPRAPARPGQARAWPRAAISPHRADPQQIKALGTILLITERRELVGDVLLASPNHQGKHFTLTHLCSVLSRYIWLYNLQKVRSKRSCCWQEAPGSLRWPI